MQWVRARFLSLGRMYFSERCTIKLNARVAQDQFSFRGFLWATTCQLKIRRQNTNQKRQKWYLTFMVIESLSSNLSAKEPGGNFKWVLGKGGGFSPWDSCFAFSRIYGRNIWGWLKVLLALALGTLWVWECVCPASADQQITGAQRTQHLLGEHQKWADPD